MSKPTLGNRPSENTQFSPPPGLTSLEGPSSDDQLIDLVRQEQGDQSGDLADRESSLRDRGEIQVALAGETQTRIESPAAPQSLGQGAIQVAQSTQITTEQLEQAGTRETLFWINTRALVEQFLHEFDDQGIGDTLYTNPVILSGVYDWITTDGWRNYLMAPSSERHRSELREGVESLIKVNLDLVDLRASRGDINRLVEASLRSVADTRYNFGSWWRQNYSPAEAVVPPTPTPRPIPSGPPVTTEQLLQAASPDTFFWIRVRALVEPNETKFADQEINTHLYANPVILDGAYRGLTQQGGFQDVGHLHDTLRANFSRANVEVTDWDIEQLSRVLIRTAPIVSENYNQWKAQQTANGQTLGLSSILGLSEEAPTPNLASIMRASGTREAYFLGQVLYEIGDPDDFDNIQYQHVPSSFHSYRPTLHSDVYKKPEVLEGIYEALARRQFAGITDVEAALRANIQPAGISLSDRDLRTFAQACVAALSSTASGYERASAVRQYTIQRRAESMRASHERMRRSQ